MLKNLTLIVTETKDGWFIGQVAEVPEAISQGKTLDELKENINDALQLIFSVRLDEAKKSLKKTHYKTYDLPFCNVWNTISLLNIYTKITVIN